MMSFLGIKYLIRDIKLLCLRKKCFTFFVHYYDLKQIPFHLARFKFTLRYFSHNLP